MKDLMLYIHIPFCVRKCLYCDFLSFPVGACHDDTLRSYVNRLCDEIRATATAPEPRLTTTAPEPRLTATEAVSGTADTAATSRTYRVTSIFFGGGTPSLLSIPLLQQIMDTVRNCFYLAEDAEISIEVNPCTATPEKMTGLKKLGFNRVSIGVQSFQDAELRTLGRVHDAATALKAVETARKAGFTNINLDLMSAIPGQTAESYEQNLRKAISLSVPHISAYSLILEEGTPFYDMYEYGRAPLPDEDTEREMYEMTDRILSEAGYHRYEISNYALPGRECRHNTGYWQRREYLGFGPGAASFLNHVRYQNPSDLDSWTKSTAGQAGREAEVLSPEDEMAEFMYLGLRMTEGVKCADFEQAFGRSLSDVYGNVIEDLMKKGLLTRRADAGYRLTKRGIDVSNTVFVGFLPDETGT